MLLGITSLVPRGEPSDPPPARLVRGAESCTLGFDLGRPACGCADLPGKLRRLFGLPIPLNRAQARDLEALPGIGPVRAQAIVAARRRAGAFRRLEDLQRVRGIGRSTLRRLRPHLFVGGPDPACAGLRPEGS